MLVLRHRLRHFIWKKMLCMLAGAQAAVGRDARWRLHPRAAGSTGAGAGACRAKLRDQRRRARIPVG